MVLLGMQWCCPPWRSAPLRKESIMPSAINSGDTAWMLVSTALVMLMTPALGFFYGGLVRRKNVLSTIMHSFFMLALISVQWVLWGYTWPSARITAASSAAWTGSASTASAWTPTPPTP